MAHDQIVQGIYKAATGMLPWEAVLAQIADAFDCWCVHFMGIDKVAGSVMFAHVGGAAPAAANLDYIRNYHRIDQRTRLLLSLGPDAWVHCHQHFDEAHVAADPFWQDFLIPYGGRYVSGTKVFEDAAVVAVLGAHRGRGSTPLGVAEIQGLMLLVEHFSAALRIRLQLRKEASEMATGAALLEAFSCPMALVDEHRAIRFRNAACEAALQESKYIVNRHGMIGCPDRRSDAELTIVIQSLGLAQSPATDIKPSRHGLGLVRRDSTDHVSVHLSVLRPSETLGVFGPTPLALLVFADPNARSELDPFIVGEMFGLTPAQAKVATMIAGGLAPNEIAEQTGLKLSTIRTHIRAVFERVGVNREPDLVRLLSSAPPLLHR